MVLVGVLVSACAHFADAYRRPVMLRPEREAFMASTGAYLPWPMKEAFIRGQVVPGMSWELVDLMYGRADKALPCPGDSLCQAVLLYGANNNHTVGSVSLRDDLVVKATGQLADACRF